MALGGLRIKQTLQFVTAGLIALMPLVSVEPNDESIARWCGKLGLPASRE